MSVQSLPEPTRPASRHPSARSRLGDDGDDRVHRRDLRGLGRLFASGDFKRLLEAADAVLLGRPDSATARRARAVALLRLGRPGDAAATLAGSADARTNAEAASILGLALFQSGEWAAARRTLAAARRIDRRYAPAWANLGAMLAAQGDRTGAGRAFRRALDLDPGLDDARTDHARMRLEAGRLEAAREILRPAFDPAGRPLALHLLLAKVCAKLNDQSGALAAAGAAVAAAPRSAEARGEFASALHAAAHHEAALAQFRRAARLAPRDTRPLLGAVEALRKLGRPDAAWTILRRALKRHPDSPTLESARAALLFDRRDFKAALAAARRAQALSPGDAGPELQAGSILFWAGRGEEAKAAYEQALALDPRNAGGWNGYGLLHLHAGRFRAAARAFNRGLSVQPNHPGCLFSLGLAALTVGDWAAGWPLYEWRWMGSSLGLSVPRPNVPGLAWWAGGPLAGRRLLVLGEQGFGDNIQFARLLAMAPGPSRIVYAVARPLHRLLRQSLADAPFPIEVIDIPEIPRARADAFVTLMSLPARLGLTQASLPPFTPWLRADPAEAEAWGARLPAGGPRVGLVWRGNPELITDRWRSTDLSAWRPLLRLPGVAWVSLQKLEAGKRGAKVARERRLLAAEGVIDPTEDLVDFAATAALIEALDLVIAVDTSVAHLAGAMGKPVWMLNRASSEWRWGWRQTRSDWYPTMRIFNQPRAGDWTPVLARVRRELVRAFPGRRGRPSGAGTNLV